MLSFLSHRLFSTSIFNHYLSTFFFIVRMISLNLFLFSKLAWYSPRNLDHWSSGFKKQRAIQVNSRKERLLWETRVRWDWKVVRTSGQLWKSAPSSGLCCSLCVCCVLCSHWLPSQLYLSFPGSSKLHFAQGPASWGTGTVLGHHFLIGLHPRLSKFRLFEPLCLMQLFTSHTWLCQE